LAKRAAVAKSETQHAAPMISRLPAFALATFLAVTAHAGDADFRAIFNGKDLTDWDGNPKLWMVKDGAIRGETALPDRLTLGNTFLIWRGGKLADFELKLKVRIQNGNSGVQYRSTDRGKWVVSGYQAEVDNAPGKAGFLYDEKGRGKLALVGEKVEFPASGNDKAVAPFPDKDELTKGGYFKAKDWNDYRIVARGERLEHWINGVKLIEFIDHDEKRGAREGVLALQIHAGGPMIVEFKDILLKNL
jgi:hypothetical protein